VDRTGGEMCEDDWSYKGTGNQVREATPYIVKHLCHKCARSEPCFHSSLETKLGQEVDVMIAHA